MEVLLPSRCRAQVAREVLFKGAHTGGCEGGVVCGVFDMGRDRFAANDVWTSVRGW